ncbi:DUF4357 domain-containing protein [Alicyclobacillus sp. SO9]|uniref:DUF4357 domain-containing protein n=1 Tax=Alicyclobacillus sp. SO9 TaxID=2665646 RepID=UPI00351C71F4
MSSAVSFSALSAVRKKDIEDLLSNGVIVDKGDYYEFEKNHRFSSPSYAAVIVLGRNVSGLTEWKCASLTLRDYEFEQNSALTAQC